MLVMLEWWWKKAALFDLDGVLVDSRVPVERQWQRWSRDHGLDANRVIHLAHGQPTIDTVRQLAPQLDASSEAAIIESREIEDKDGLRAIAGAKELLLKLPAQRWAIVTSGTRELATARLEHVGLPLPPVMVPADEVAQGKPHPEPYLTAAKHLGFAPVDCFVVEDSPSGIQAARAAGIQVIAVTTTYEAAEVKQADIVVTSLQHISIDYAVEREMMRISWQKSLVF